MTKTVSIAEILQDTIDSTDFGSIFDYARDDDNEDDARTKFWNDVIETKSTDSGFDSLVTSILTYGWIEGSCVGYYTDADGGGYLTEGHHRLVAAILLGMDSVPVSDWGDSKNTPAGRVSAHHDYVSERVSYLI